jgi:hypothetical protein
MSMLLLESDLPLVESIGAEDINRRKSWFIAHAKHLE